MSEDEGESLARRRSRRSTAGNRMEAALAEFEAMNTVIDMEMDDDKDFSDKADEEEIFDSDFESTDEEAAQEDGSTIEKELLAEERQARRSERQRTAKATEAALSKQRARINGTVSGPSTSKNDTVKKRVSRNNRRVSMGTVVDAETGQAISAARKSRRKSTMQSSESLASRLKDAEEQRATLPKRVREAAHTYTQAELIARALDTEEGNIADHRNYLAQEEEKRRRVKVVRQTLQGPILRWVSRVEDEVKEPEVSSHPTTPSAILQLARQKLGAAISQSGLSSGYPFSPSLDEASNSTHKQITEASKVKVSKNYLIYELDQQDGLPKPDWSQTMSTIFGTHVNWDEVKVYTGKHRPLSRPVVKCPLTGRPAIYRDPRTGVPYANAEAYQTLTKIIAHEYIWNEALHCYTTSEKSMQIEEDVDDDK